MYPNLKKTILERLRLSPDKDENRLSTQDKLSKRQLREKVWTNWLEASSLEATGQGLTRPSF